MIDGIPAPGPNLFLPKGHQIGWVPLFSQTVVNDYMGLSENSVYSNSHGAKTPQTAFFSISEEKRVTLRVQDFGAANLAQSF